MKILNHASGHRANHPASEVPNASDQPATISNGAPNVGAIIPIAHATNPQITPPIAMIGTTIELAITPTVENWLK